MRHGLLCVTTLSLATVVCCTANADQHLDQLANLIDSQFKSFAESLSSSQSHKVLTRKNSGATALDFSVDLLATKLEHHSFLEEYTTKDSPDTLYIPRLHLNTGQGDGWNASAFYSSVPQSAIEIYGGEVRYSLLSNERFLPEVRVRGMYSQLTGVDDMLIKSTGLELSFSKGFSGITPYAGFGTTRVDGEDALDGNTSSLMHNKYFMGLQFDLGLMSFSAETEQAGDTATTRAKMGIHF